MSHARRPRAAERQRARAEALQCRLNVDVIVRIAVEKKIFERAAALDDLLQDPNEGDEVASAHPPMSEIADAAVVGGIEVPDERGRVLAEYREQPLD